MYRRSYNSNGTVMNPWSRFLSFQSSTVCLPSAHNAHSHVGVAEVPKALQEVEEVLGLPHRHRRLERPEGPVAGQLAALGPDGLPQRLPATRAVKVHMQLHLNE